MTKDDQICYLCGNVIDKGDIDRDHVPPRQFYSKNLRKKHSPNLLTLPVHSACNKSYQKDEDYFVHSIGPLAKGSYSGNGIWQDISHQFKKSRGQRIGQMILNEFEDRPSGLYLPSGKIVKRFDEDRVWRVVWKIIRGLFFKEHNRILPHNTLQTYHKIITPEHEVTPPEFAVVRDTPSRGQYPGVFDYKYVVIPELNNFHFWALLLWSKIIKLIAFHDPDCECEPCAKKIQIRQIKRI